MPALILYSSKYGSTELAAKKLAALTGADEVKFQRRTSVDLDAYDTVILGSPIYMGRISPLLSQFLDKYEEALYDKKLYIFLTCAFQKDFKRALVYNFSFELLEKAIEKACFGGEIDTSKKLKFTDKMFLRLMAKQSGNTLPEVFIDDAAIEALALKINGAPEGGGETAEKA